MENLELYEPLWLPRNSPEAGNSSTLETVAKQTKG